MYLLLICPRSYDVVGNEGRSKKGRKERPGALVMLISLRGGDTSLVRCVSWQSHQICRCLRPARDYPPTPEKRVRTTRRPTTRVYLLPSWPGCAPRHPSSSGVWWHSRRRSRAPALPHLVSHQSSSSSWMPGHRVLVYVRPGIPDTRLISHS